MFTGKAHGALPLGGYGTFVGSICNQNIKYTFNNCVDLGELTLEDASASGNLIGLPARKDGTSAITVTASKVYVTNASGRPASYLGSEPNGLVFTKNNVNTVEPSTLEGLTAEQLLVKFPETVAGAGCDWGYANDGTLMPKGFITWYNAQ